MIRAVDHRRGQLELVELPPEPLRPGALRLRVRASGVNRADLAQRAGTYPPPPGASPILGLEAAGEVIEVASDVQGWSPGDRAAVLLAGGGYQSELVVDARHALPVPPGASWAEAGAFVEVFATAWLNLQDEGGLRGRVGASVVLHAGASGVGTAAIQLCRLLGHAAFVTVGSADKLDRCLALGAEAGCDRHQGPWIEAARAWRPDGVDMILDPVGAAYLDQNLQALATDGRLVLIGLLSGRRADLDLGRLLVRRLHITGSTLRSRSDDAKARLIADLRQHVLPAWEDGRLHPRVDEELPIDRVAQAHDKMASNQTFGCLVLRWD